MLLISFALLALVNGYSCPRGRNSECIAVSTNPRYVECVNQQCACKTDLGFVGDASPSSKCSCPNGFDIFHDHGDPYCVKLSDAVAHAQQKRRDARLLGTIRDLYASLIWPTPAAIMGQLITGQTTGGIWDLVAEDAYGRVDPLGEFTNKDGIVEYFYGQVWSGGSQIQQAQINKLLVDGNKVTVAVDMHFYIYDNWPGNLVTDYNLTQTGVFTFDEQDRIKSMDLVIHNLGHAVNWFFADQEAEYQRVCSLVLFVANCDETMDPEGYYTDMDDCLSFMRTKEFGSWDNIRTDTVSCRQFHSILAIARPEVHCSHSGKTGGKKCVPRAYTEYYDKQY